MHEVQDDNQMTWNFTLVNLMSSFEVERLRENEKKKRNFCAAVLYLQNLHYLNASKIFAALGSRVLSFTFSCSVF